MALLPDLDVKSVLEVVEENFQKVGLKTYALRIIYIGEHMVPKKEEFINELRKTIQDVNSGYCDINIHGLLLVYDSYFVHILETYFNVLLELELIHDIPQGSEDTVHRQLRFIFRCEIEWIAETIKKDEEARLAAIKAAQEAAEEAGVPFVWEPVEEPPKERKMFKKLKVLMVYHSIKTLTFDHWRAVTARPPSLVGRLDIHGPLSEHMEQLRICLDKITKLCGLAKQDDNLSFEGLSAADHKMDALPEVALLDFLIQSPHVMDLRHTMYLHRRVDDYCFYFESVWPLPTHFTPRHLYKLKVDDSFVEPLPVMPWEMVKKEVNEDEEQERQSGSSDSD